MKITFNLFDQSTKRKVYFFASLVFIILSGFIILNSEHQHRKLKNILIESSLNEYQAEITHGLNVIRSNQVQALRILTSNAQLSHYIQTNDSVGIGAVLMPLFQNIFSSSGTYIQIRDSLGNGVFRVGVSESSSIIRLSPIEGSSNLSIDQNFLLSPEGLFFVSSLPIGNPSARNTIEIGVKDSHAFSFLEAKPDGIIFTTFYKNFIPEFSNHGSFDWNHLLIRPYAKPEVVKALAHEGIPSMGERIYSKVKGNHYVLMCVGEFSLSGGQRAGQVLFALDISPFQRVYNNYLIRIFLFTGVLLVFTLLLIWFGMDRLVRSWLKIESALMRKLTLRTQEIIDTNTEFRQLFNSTANGIRIINQNYEVTRVNDAFCRISGLSREQIEGRFCYNVFSGVFCHTSNCPLKRLMDGEKAVEVEEVRFKRDGQKVICQHSAVPFLGKNGEFLGIIEDFKDITEKREAEHALRRTQAQFSSFMDSIPVGIHIKDSDGRVTYQNTYFTTHFCEAYLKERHKALLESSGGPLSSDEIQALKVGRVEVEELLTDRNGNERTFVSHKFRFFGLENKWLIGNVSIDISKRKAAEHQLYILSKAIRNSPVGVAITTPQGTIEFLNPEYERIAGKFSSDLMGMPILGMNQMDDNPMRTAMAVAMAGETWQGETYLELTPSKSMWISLSVAPVFNRKNEVAHLIFLIENITPRKNFEKEILIAKNRAEDSDRLKTAFLANLSHEIRTPLNAIIGFSSLLNEPGISQEEQVQIPDMLYKHSNALLGIIDNIIDVAAIETNQFRVKKDECSVNQLINEIFSEVCTLDTRSSNVKIHMKLEVQEESFTIQSDSNRLRQVLKHLISNAMKFTEQGYIEIGYTFRDADNLLFYVMDTGIGMDDETKSKIFNPFTMADDSNTRRYNGLGLGLAISRHIVEQLGGKLWVQSTLGQGSTFFFTTPYIPLHSKFDVREVGDGSPLSFNWDNKTILVADDYDSNFKYLQALIKPTRANVIWAKNGREAIYLASSSKIDLVLMDIVMPEMNGFEATKQIKRINSKVPVICQTAYPSAENIRASKECGMDTLLSKPITVQSMLRTIDRFISTN